jgi:hypothetical protein
MPTDYVLVEMPQCSKGMPIHSPYRCTSPRKLASDVILQFWLGLVTRDLGKDRRSRTDSVPMSGEDFLRTGSLIQRPLVFKFFQMASVVWIPATSVPIII